MSGELKIQTRSPFGALILTRLNALGAVGAAFDDSVFAIKGSVDATKKVRFEVDGLTTATTRVVTVPDANLTLTGSASALTSGRVPFATTGGLLTDSANLTYASGTLKVNDATASSSTTTGALVITGGAGIGGAANIGGNVTITNASLPTLTINNTTTAASSWALKHLANGDLQIIQPSQNNWITLTHATGKITSIGPVLISDATASVSNITGALVVTGGIASSGNSYFSGATINFTSGAASSSTTTGNVVVTGGVGIGGAVNVGGTIANTGSGKVFTAESATTQATYARLKNSSGELYLGVEASTAANTFTGSAAYDAVIFANSNLWLTSPTIKFGISAVEKMRLNSSGGLELRQTSSNNYVGQGTGWIWTSDGTATGTVRGGAFAQSGGTLSLFGGSSITSHLTISSAGDVSISNTTASSSTSTGALLVSGGVGVAKAIYSADSVVVTRASGTPMLALEQTGGAAASASMYFLPGSAGGAAYFGFRGALNFGTASSVGGAITTVASFDTTGNFSCAGVTASVASGGISTCLSLKNAGNQNTDRGSSIALYGPDSGGSRVLGSLVVAHQTAASLGAYMTFNVEGVGGAGVLVEAMRLTRNGSVILGTQAALSTSATDGFAYMPTCAGTPTGTPTAWTGKAAWVYDTTNNKIYVYNGTWKATAALT